MVGLVMLEETQPRTTVLVVVAAAMMKAGIQNMTAVRVHLE